MHLFHSLATFAAGLFAGTTLYVSAVAQPARMKLGAAIALPTYQASLVRSERLNPALHVASIVFLLAACTDGFPVERLAALALLAPILPISLIVIRPLNSGLRDPARADPERAMLMLQRWGRLHAVRTVLGLAAFLALALRP